MFRQQFTRRAHRIFIDIDRQHGFGSHSERCKGMKSGPAANIEESLSGKAFGEQFTDARNSGFDALLIDGFGIVLPVLSKLEMRFAFGQTHAITPSAARNPHPQDLRWHESMPTRMVSRPQRGKREAAPRSSFDPARAVQSTPLFHPRITAGVRPGKRTRERRLRPGCS